MTHCDVHRIKLNLLLAQIALLWIFFPTRRRWLGWLSTNHWLEIMSEPSINCHYRWGHSLKWKIRTILQRIMFQDSVSAKQFVERGKLVTTVHRLMQFFTVSVYGSIRPRAVGPGLTIFFNISYLVITQSWTRNATTMAGIFFSIVTLLLCFREESHSEN